MGLDAVCDGCRAFINCSQDMLLKGFFQLLPAEKAVVRDPAGHFTTEDHRGTFYV
jgi:c-di-GMP-related signal transduction protein